MMSIPEEWWIYARAKRANAQISTRTKDQFAPGYGVVFCDAPCSESGS